MSTEKKVGRKAAGSWGRPKSRKQKRAASKGVRKMTRKEIEMVPWLTIVRG
jgi:hypothetical protein